MGRPFATASLITVLDAEKEGLSAGEASKFRVDPTEREGGRERESKRERLVFFLSHILIHLSTTCHTQVSDNQGSAPLHEMKYNTHDDLGILT